MYEAPGITVVPAASCAPKRTFEVSKIRVLSEGIICPKKRGNLSTKSICGYSLASLSSISNSLRYSSSIG